MWYFNPGKKGKDILKLNSTINNRLIHQFEKAMPIKKFPDLYKAFLLKYEIGEDRPDSLFLYYFAKGEKVRSYPIHTSLKKQDLTFSYFLSLPEVYKYLLHHDNNYGAKGFHRRFKIIKIGISSYDFDGFYLGIGSKNQDYIYYVQADEYNFEEIDSNEFQNKFMISKDIFQFIDSLYYGK